jgi:deoxyribodipyrimidine photo-lyase
MNKEISIVWFRQDLRISDNPTIVAASAIGEVLPIYILDDCAPELFKIGSTSKIWLHHSLSKLNESLGGNLNIYIGKADKIIGQLIKHYNIKNIYWNTCYEPWNLDQENSVKEICNNTLTQYEAFNSNYLWSPEEIMTNEGGYYKVFTAYKNKSHSIKRRSSINKSTNPRFVKDFINKTTLLDLGLIPKHHWYKNIEEYWDVGEVSAQNKLEFFMKNYLCGYKENRNYPHKEASSKLSPHLHYGEISPAQVLESINIIGHIYAHEPDIEHFVSELIWREFSCYLLYHFRSLYKDNFNSKFNNFTWEDNLSFLRAWQTGHTGYPFIDAGMRELWQTGYMHNRVRMVAASFLVKNLNIHWHHGRDWFWDCLVDADIANNSASWQWVAGSGADAAPYFRIFNPIIQGEKFDSNGDYTRKFVPELKNIPSKYLFKPWTAPENILKSAGIVLGTTYPKPIVDFSVSREKALKIYSAL